MFEFDLISFGLGIATMAFINLIGRYFGERTN
jgi:hypothetical protein